MASPIREDEGDFDGTSSENELFRSAEEVLEHRNQKNRTDSALSVPTLASKNQANGTPPHEWPVIRCSACGSSMQLRDQLSRPTRLLALPVFQELRPPKLRPEPCFTTPQYRQARVEAARTEERHGQRLEALRLQQQQQRPSWYSPLSFIRAYVLNDDVPIDQLHRKPAAMVLLSASFLFLLFNRFLQRHVLDTRDQLGLYVMGSYMVFASYFVVHYNLERYSSSYGRISNEKKFYAIANLLKASVLVSIFPTCIWHMYQIVWHGAWETNTIRNLGCIFSIPDFVSMLAVRRMSWSTWCHHAFVVSFNYFSVMNDYTEENVCRLVVVYAAFSTLSYCVNFLLASRFLGVPTRLAQYLAWVSLVVYISSCAINWIWQVYYLHRLTVVAEHWTVYLYMFAVCFIIWDDIVLCRWLLHNALNYVALSMSLHRTTPLQSSFSP